MDDLKKLVEAMRSASDIEFVEAFKRNALNDSIDAGNIETSNENQTTPDGRPFDQRVRVTIDGAEYYIGLYEV